jgi:hypothetical protein
MDANTAAATLDIAESRLAAGRLSDVEPLFRRAAALAPSEAVIHQ